ncbi:hypothetical protein [Metabacillus litoralis]|uniref:hypothetical protein n=1 Tax=Metabacillus litoralis TaxID=152268 RepID=UPI001CFC7786|nr:hypothetical protein [Metabacillus litoralis]
MNRKGVINRNSTPFFILAIIHIGMILYLVYRKQGKLKWFVLLANIGFSYVFEYFILNLFNAYKYKPSILKNPALDNILGAILSQAFFIPITATFLTVTKANWLWKFGFSIYFFIIEKLFIKLRVYQLIWWKSHYTLILLPIAFSISDGMQHALEQNEKWAQRLVHYLSLVVISITLLFIPASSKQIRFGFGFYRSWKKHFIIAPLYSFYLSFIVFMTSTDFKPIKKMTALLMMFFSDCLLCRLNILKTSFQSSLTRLFFHIFMIYLSNFLYYIIRRQPQNS